MIGFSVLQPKMVVVPHKNAHLGKNGMRDVAADDPTDSFAHWYLSEAYRYGGALEQSIAEGQLALRLNPEVGENQTFNTYLYAGQ